jgi:hypothetical protein
MNPVRNQFEVSFDVFGFCGNLMVAGVDSKPFLGTFKKNSNHILIE